MSECKKRSLKSVALAVTTQRVKKTIKTSEETKTRRVENEKKQKHEEMKTDIFELFKVSKITTNTLEFFKVSNITSNIFELVKE